MTSVQRYLSGHDNLVRGAALAASSVAASTAVSRTLAQRAGGGRVRVAGNYTGHAPAEIEIEIVNGHGVPRASAPVFTGVGNGTLTVGAVSPAAALHALSFTLTDLGILTEHARLDVREVLVRARAAGTAGNAIHLTVAPRLTATATDYALLADWSAGAMTQAGAQWNFGGLPVTAAGEIDVNSPRLQFGSDPQVYRPFRTWKDGQWLHGLTPTPENAISAGTRVFSIAGGYEVTVSADGAAEVFGAAPAAPIVTFYDLLTALAASSLVEVAGVVAADRQPGGQAAIDVPLRTAAWLLAASGKALAGISIPAAAPTQALTVRCVNADKVGAERWEVSGSVSGALPSAVTGTPYVSAAANFTVPTIKPPADASGEWNFSFAPASRADGEGVPAICVRPFRFGPSARPKSVTFKYSKRPPADCDCRKMPTPTLDMACLGLEEIGGSIMEPAVKTRLLDLYAWRAQAAAANTKIKDIDAATGYVDANTVDLDLIHGIAGEFASALSEIAAEPLALAQWDSYVVNVKTALARYSLGDAKLLAQIQEEIPGSEGDDGMRPASVAESIEARKDQFNSGNHFYRGLAKVIDGPYAGQARYTDWFDYSSEARAALSSLVAAMRNDYAWQDRPVKEAKPPEGVIVEFDSQRFIDRVRSQCDHVRILAGIFPKTDASSGGAGGCWQEDKTATHWWVDQDGYYQPAFSNFPYISTRMDTETGVRYSTQEFGFGLVVACPERLREGDAITINIAQTDSARPYQVGDEAVLQTIASGPAYLAGGIDGTDELIWSVTSSVDGPLPAYHVPLNAAPPPWAQAGAEITIAPGGIAFALGDTFSLAIEAGQFRWRRAAGAWSAPADIPPAGGVPLADGLEAFFDPGAAPGWVAGDFCAFHAAQPNAPGHLADMTDSAWRWAGDGGTVVVDFGKMTPLAGVALARYLLPAGSTVSLGLSTDGVVYTAPPHALDTSGRVAVALFASIQARYLRLEITDAPGGEIGVLWAGLPFATTHHASTCRRQRRWGVTRAGGLNPASLYAGKGDGWGLAWDECLDNEDANTLLALADFAQQRGEPLIFVPHHLHLADAALVTLGEDALAIEDVHEYQPDAASARLLSATLTLDPVYA